MNYTNTQTQKFIGHSSPGTNQISKIPVVAYRCSRLLSAWVAPLALLLFNPERYK